MDPRTAEEIDFVVESPLGFSLQVDLVMRLLTRENVDEVMEYLPSAFREELVAFAGEAYLPEGERIVVGGAALPAASLEAVRFWLRQPGAVGAARRRLQGERFDEGDWTALWASASLAYTRLRADPASWAAEQAERLTWDAALGDGLEDDGYAETG